MTGSPARYGRAARSSRPACTRRRAGPARWAAIDLDTDADAEQVATLTRLTERYCVVFQTLAGRPALSLAVTAPGDRP